MINRKEIFKAAHRLAKQISESENIKYKRALSQGLKIVFHNHRLGKSAKTNLSVVQKAIIIKSNGRLLVNNTNLKSQRIINKLKQYSYKDWAAYENHQFLFSDEIINSLNQ